VELKLKIMKKLIIAIIISVSCFTACTPVDTENVSSITYFPVFTITGANPYFVTQGTTYVDPGAVAKAGSVIIPTVISANGKYRRGTTLDTSKTDEYSVTYSATNSDGFVGKGTRTVIVYKNGDLVNSIEGLYTSTTKRNGSLMSATQGSSVDMKYVYIWKNTNGTYEISDAFGGWYNIGRKIDVTSATQGGTISGNIATNTFTFPGNPLTNTYFGGSAKIDDLTVDPVAKKLVLTCTWVTLPPVSTYVFVSTLTQVNP